MSSPLLAMRNDQSVEWQWKQCHKCWIVVHEAVFLEKMLLQNECIMDKRHEALYDGHVRVNPICKWLGDRALVRMYIGTTERCPLGKVKTCWMPVKGVRGPSNWSSRQVTMQEEIAWSCYQAARWWMTMWHISSMPMERKPLSVHYAIVLEASVSNR